MLFAACMSLSSFVLQFGHSNILSFNSNSTLVLHLAQYFVVGNHLSSIIVLSLLTSLDFTLPSIECCILCPLIPSCFHSLICSSCITIILLLFRILDTILFDMSFFLLFIWIYSFLILLIVLYLLFEPFFCLLSLPCKRLSFSLSSIDISYLVPSDRVKLVDTPISMPTISFL